MWLLLFLPCKLLAHGFGTHNGLLLGLLYLLYKRKSFVPWVASPSSIHGNKTITTSNPLESFGKGRNQLFQMKSKQA